MSSAVLVLNATYEPLKVIDWKRAMTLWFMGKVEILEAYANRIVKSAKEAFQLPAVVRLVEYVPWRRRTMKFSRENVYLRDQYTCQYCLRQFSPRELTFDHVLPRSRGGRTNWKNIVTSCKPCNQRKGDLTPKEAKMELIRAPYVPKHFSKDVFGGKATVLWEPYLVG